jgi:hypothetical protein
MSSSCQLLSFCCLQLVVFLILFLSEIWVFQTKFAPRISSFMAFPFCGALFVATASGFQLAARRRRPSAVAKALPAAGSVAAPTLYLASQFLSLIWMVRWWSAWLVVWKARSSSFGVGGWGGGWVAGCWGGWVGGWVVGGRAVKSMR